MSKITAAFEPLNKNLFPAHLFYMYQQFFVWDYHYARPRSEYWCHATLKMTLWLNQGSLLLCYLHLEAELFKVIIVQRQKTTTALAPQHIVPNTVTLTLMTLHLTYRPCNLFYALIFSLSDLVEVPYRVLKRVLKVSRSIRNTFYSVPESRSKKHFLPSRP